jgi:hypothetical protein
MVRDRSERFDNENKGEALMMVLVGLLSTLATLTIYVIISKFSSLGDGWAFGLSWIGIFLCAGALSAKETAVRNGISFPGRWVATFCAVMPVVIGAPSFLELWNSGSGFWFTALLLWFGLVSFMSVWVPLQAAE